MDAEQKVEAVRVEPEVIWRGFDNGGRSRRIVLIDAQAIPQGRFSDDWVEVKKVTMPAWEIIAELHKVIRTIAKLASKQ